MFPRPFTTRKRHLDHPPSLRRVLSGVLTAVDVLDHVGYLHRDIKGDNVLVRDDGTGILADFGLCVGKSDACKTEMLGDGTSDYCALEIVQKRSGSTLATELFSLFVVFVESVMRRHPFGGEVRQLSSRVQGYFRGSHRRAA